eukprot:1941932-Pyramimonas_sp.AAC.1
MAQPNFKGTATIKSDKLVLISANITSWKKNITSLFSHPADLYVVQETRLTALATERAGSLARTKGMTFLGGKPLPVKQLRPKTSPTMECTAIHGGVAIMGRPSFNLQPCAARTTAAKQVYELSRHMRAVLPVYAGTSTASTHFLHLVSFYNDADHGPAATLRKERHLDKVLEDGISCGEQPVIICADANVTDRSVVLQDAIATGLYIDIGARFAIGGPPAPTCCGKDFD